MPDKNITFEIKEHIGVITRYDSGWNKELNLISWNGGTNKYDLRDWDPHHERMRRGVTLFEGEMRKMVNLYLNNNSQKAVERGRAIEEDRRARQKAQQENQSRDICLETAEAEAFEEAVPPSAETAGNMETQADGETAETAAAEALQLISAEDAEHPESQEIPF